MSFWEVFISLRFLKINRKHFYINACNILAGIGIFLGVFSLIVVLSMMNGLESNIRDILFEFQPDIVVSRGSLPVCDATISTVEGIFGKEKVFRVYKMPLIAKQGMTFKGVELYAVDSEYLSLLLNFEEISRDFLYLGRLLSMELLLRQGDYIELLLPFSRSIDSVSVKITNIFESRLVDIDLNSVYMDRAMFMNKFSISPQINELHIKVNSSGRDIKRQSVGLTELLGDEFLVSTIYDRNRDLFAAMKLERVAMVIMLSIIILLGCFNIISSLLMMVTKKTQDIGILRTLGGEQKSIKRIFAFQGIFIGFLSTITGAISGTILSIILDKYQLLTTTAQGLYLDYIPFKVEISNIFIVLFLSLAINLISTYIPTKNISDLNIIKALYYDGK